MSHGELMTSSSLSPGIKCIHESVIILFNPTADFLFNDNMDVNSDIVLKIMNRICWIYLYSDTWSDSLFGIKENMSPKYSTYDVNIEKK